MSQVARKNPVRWRWLLTGGFILGLLGFVVTPRVQHMLGIFDYGVWFMDSYAVLAAGDTVRAGGNPEHPMEFDVLHRTHNYSDWWLVLGKVGLSRDDNFLVGGLWVTGFVMVACFFLRPKSAGETAWYLSLLLSPPVLLAVNRANNDLVIFALLGIAAILLRRWSTWRIGMALAMLALATGLKFYPVVAGAVFLLARPRHTLVIALVAATVVLGTTLWSVAPTIARGQFFMTAWFYTFGAAVWLQDCGLNAAWWPDIAMLAVAGLAVWLERSRRLVPPEDFTGDNHSRDPAGFVIGAMVIAASFFAGISFSYRCIFLILAAPWIWQSASARGSGRVIVWLMVVVMWLDGLLSLGLDLGHNFFSQYAPTAVGHVWRLMTQPLVWLLVIVLVAWLLQVLISALRTLSASGRTSSQPR